MKGDEQEKGPTVIGSLELAEAAGAPELAEIIHACTCTRTRMNTVAAVERERERETNLYFKQSGIIQAESLKRKSDIFS